MVAGQVFHEDGALIDQGRVGLFAAEARAGRGERGVGEGDSRQAGYLLAGGPQQLGGDLAVVAQLQVDRQGLLG